MTVLDKLELQLTASLDKKAPVSLPSNARKSLASALWWIALAFGILQLWSATALWHVGHIANQIVTYSNYAAVTYGTSVAAPPHLGLFYWISLWVLAVGAILLLVASPQLKQMKKSGWNLVYYSAVLNAIYAILSLFSGVRGGLGEFISAAFGTVLGAYFLFQVRRYFVEDEGKHIAHQHNTRQGHEKSK